MNTRRRSLRRQLSAVVFMGIVVCTASPSKYSPGDDEPPLTQQIQADDITSRRVQIIGRLGHPLGEMLTIRGQWKPPGQRVKDLAFHFVVTEVEGKKLATSVEFHGRGVSLPRGATPESLIGKLCELRGYEGASFWGGPARFHREKAGLVGDGESPVADPWGFKFMSEFHAAVLTVIDQPVEAAHANADRNVPHRPKRIEAADLTSKRFQIIGRLGHPLGEMLTIRGQWQHPDSRVKDYSLRFAATEVEGEKLTASVVFERGGIYLPRETSPESLEGKLCELRGFEGGRFRGAPNDFYEKAVQQPHGFGFATEFHTASVKVIAGQPQRAKATTKSRGVRREVNK